MKERQGLDWSRAEKERKKRRKRERETGEEKERAKGDTMEEQVKSNWRIAVGTKHYGSVRYVLSVD